MRAVPEGELGLVKRTAVGVKSPRGPIVAEDGLLAYAHSGAIAGARVDVYDEEPLPGGHPLRLAPRTVLTPYLGYMTDHRYRTFQQDAVEDIAACAAGARPRHRAVPGKPDISYQVS
jgi:phosphoglycerate dehydrogenase-like enzyme